MPITKDYEFTCQTCREAFQIFLPEQTTLASFDKCLEDDVKHHSLPLMSRCQNCEHLNTVYFAYRDILSSSHGTRHYVFDGYLRHISTDKVVAMWSEFEYC